MAETRTIELNIVDNANQTQQQFENLRQQIAKTTQEVDELTSAYGENSQEVTEAKGRLNELNTSYKELNKSATDTGATFANVYGEMQPLTTRMGEAEDRLYELALAGKTATKEYQDLLKVTQNYLRVQQQVDLQVDAGAVPAAVQEERPRLGTAHTGTTWFLHAFGGRTADNGLGDARNCWPHWLCSLRWNRRSPPRWSRWAAPTSRPM